MKPHVAILFELLRTGLARGAGEGCGSGKGGGQVKERCRVQAAELAERLMPLADDGRLWQRLYDVALEQGVQAIAWDGLMRVAEAAQVSIDGLISRKLKMRWIYSLDSTESTYAMQYCVAAELARLYADNGIRTVVLKGIAASLNYPEPKHRPCGDMDCFLMGDYKRGNEVARAAGAKVRFGFYKHSHIEYKGLTVENHQFCTAVRGSRRAKAFERLLQQILREQPTSVIGTTCLEAPSPLFNALFLICHAQRHLLSEGIVLRHLCDWAMFVDKHGPDVDWTEFSAVCDRYGLRHFADSMSRLSRIVLGVELPSSYLVEADDERDKYLLDEILYGMQHKPASSRGSKWMQRLRLFGNISKNRRRYRLFADVSYLHDLAKLAYGFVFDRNPKI